MLFINTLSYTKVFSDFKVMIRVGHAVKGFLCGDFDPSGVEKKKHFVKVKLETKLGNMMVNL